MINGDWREELTQGHWGIRGECLIDEPLDGLNTWRVGGPADLLVRPLDVEDVHTLFAFIRHHRVPWRVLGGGSNLLIADKGVRGLVIQLSDMNRIIQSGPCELTVGAGCPLSHLVKEAVRLGYAGFESLAGIPGTVGGAVTGNAGALGQQISDCLKSALVVENAAVERWERDEFHFGYRSSSIGDKHMVLEVVFVCERSEHKLLREKVVAARDHRRQAHAVKGATAGSVFKNPPQIQVWKLIDQCGLRGKSIGDAQVSQHHTNFIVNRGSATADEIVQLMTLIQQTVMDQTGVCLYPEVHHMGEFDELLSDQCKPLHWAEEK